MATDENAGKKPQDYFGLDEFFEFAERPEIKVIVHTNAELQIASVTGHNEVCFEIPTSELTGHLGIDFQRDFNLQFYSFKNTAERIASIPEEKLNWWHDYAASLKSA